MVKKLTVLLATVAALVFAVPAVATAAPILVNSATGKLLPTFTEITGRGFNINLTSSTLGGIYCEELDLNATLWVNNMTSGFTAVNAGEFPFSKKCNNPNGTVIVERVTVTDLKSTVGGTATASFTAEIEIGFLLKCKFTGTNVAGTYANGGSILTFTSATGITSSPAGCGTVKLDGVFFLSQRGGEGLKAVF